MTRYRMKCGITHEMLHNIGILSRDTKQRLLSARFRVLRHDGRVSGMPSVTTQHDDWRMHGWFVPRKYIQKV